MLSSQHPSKSNRFSSLGFTGSWDFSGVVVGAGLFHLVRRFLVMVATLLFISVVNLWYGISKLCVCRGLSLRSPATASRYCSLYTLRSVPFLGKKILSEQSVRVFIGTALPWRMWITKIHIHI